VLGLPASRYAQIAIGDVIDQKRQFPGAIIRWWRSAPFQFDTVGTLACSRIRPGVCDPRTAYSLEFGFDVRRPNGEVDQSRAIEAAIPVSSTTLDRGVSTTRAMKMPLITSHTPILPTEKWQDKSGLKIRKRLLVPPRITPTADWSSKSAISQTGSSLLQSRMILPDSPRRMISKAAL
jgi:hypothetical protein